MSLLTLYFLFVHWFADFRLQTEHMALRKSTSNYYLGMHVTVYSVVTIFFWWLCFLITGQHASVLQYFLAFVALFAMHFATDYVTSRITGKLYAAKKVGLFFDVIGIDQWLHYAQIYLVYNFIILNT